MTQIVKKVEAKLLHRSFVFSRIIVGTQIANIVTAKLLTQKQKNISLQEENQN